MRAIGVLIAILGLATSSVFLSPSGAAAKTVCPVDPLPGSTISGGLVVTGGDCHLVHVTVTGGITVTSTGSLEIENDSYISGGIVVQTGGELDVGHDLRGNTPSGSLPSTITGGVKFNGKDLDLYRATISGGVLIDGAGPFFFPSVCGSTISGGLAVQNVSTGAFIGDPGEGFPANCPGNVINTSVKVLNSTGVVEIESNQISGSVTITNSRYELRDNSIGGSATCTGSTPNLVEGGEASPPGNTYGGSNNGCV